MKNKLLVCMCAIAMVVGLLTSCQKDADLYAIDAQIAENSILKDGSDGRYYYFIEVDSTTMSTKLHEWKLVNDSTDRTGYYRLASTGNSEDQDVTTSLTWEKATMSEDGLSMSIPVKLGDKELVLTWKDGVLVTNDYTTERTIISLANVLRSVNDNFAGFDFVYSDTASYITSRKDTTYYLAWKTQVVSYSQEQIDSAKAALIELADTLHWFNATFPNQAVPDTVRFASKPQSDGKFKGQVSIPYETFKVDEIKTNHGPLNIINGEMVYDRVSTANTGAFSIHKQTWTEQCYTKPADTTAVQTEYLLEISNAKWTPISFINIKKFNILFKGKAHIITKKIVAGNVVEDKTEDKDDYFFEVPLSAFSRLDGEVSYEEHKYKNK